MTQSPCPRPQGLGGSEGAGTNSDTWEFMSTRASVIPPRAGAVAWEVGERRMALPAVRDQEDSQLLLSAELGRPPTKLRGRRQAWLPGRENRGCPQFSLCLPSLGLPSHILP